MKKHDLTKAVLAALLLASPLAKAESEYPAADFEPVVIIQDVDLIAEHEKAAKERVATLQAQAKQEATSSTSAAASSADQPSSAPASAAAKAENPLAENYPIALIVLGLIGFMFWSNRQAGSKREAAVPQSVAPVSQGAQGGETGVARYLKNLSEPSKAGAAETGVARYLKNLSATPTSSARLTGVAKYLKNLESSAR
ncbi:hypothetical protein [Methylocaldum szegediense]|uniref:Transmembrane protein n=1 Tax=Methylocaldum szegediense TaxID=73780 RepID=A0ABM9HXR9_9GAMM|nr:hypothetical protein [Methylocaldum szegediense]CAI8757488.1 conserved exported protein of unknown function [Methylocaldum szegediense]